MRILFVTPRFPFPPDRGDKVRPYHFAHTLSKEHEIGLVSLIDGPLSTEIRAGADRIFSMIKTVQIGEWMARFELVRSAFSPLPWQMALFRSREMQQAVEDAVREFVPDIIYTFHLRMAQYTVNLPNVYRILDLTDAVSLFLERMMRFRPFYLRPLIWRERLAVLRYEKVIGPLFDDVWLISQVDAEAIPGAKDWKNLSIIPNGVDSDYFSPQPEDTDSPLPPEPVIIFVGYMGIESISAVLYFCHKIFPKIKIAVPEARFLIVGKNPPESVRELANDPSVEVAGYVPDLAAAYRRARVSVAPMKFVVGIQNKILESMACGVPVVATPFAHEGIDAQAGTEILVASDDDIFASMVSDVLMKPELHRELSLRAREFVVRTYRWERVTEHIRCLSNIISQESGK